METKNGNGIGGKNGLPKNTPCKVQPIRDMAKIQAIKRLLHDNPRDRLFFVLGCNCGLRGVDLLRLKVYQLMDVKLDDVVQVLERKTRRDPEPKDEQPEADEQPGPELGEIVADAKVMELLKAHFNLQPKKRKRKKRGPKQNEIVINKSILDALKEYFKAYPDTQPDDPVFKSSRGGPLTSGAMGKKVKAWCKAVGVTERCGINSLRKSFAYHQIVTYGQPVNRVTRALNHSDTATTLRYCGASEDETRNMRKNIIA